MLTSEDINKLARVLPTKQDMRKLMGELGRINESLQSALIMIEQLTIKVEALVASTRR